MDSRAITCALVSSDAQLRSRLCGSVGTEAGLDVIIEISDQIQNLTSADVDGLLAAKPEIILLDIEETPAPALKLAQYLVENDPTLCLVLAGPEPTSDLLMASIRLGAAEYIRKPVSPSDLVSAIERLRRKLAAVPRVERGSVRRGNGKVHALIHPGAGQGATMTAVNLAIELHRQEEGSKVILVDLDLRFGSVDLHLGIVPEFDIVDLAKNLHRLDGEMLSSFTVAHKSGIDFLAAPMEPEKSIAVSPGQVEQAVRILRRTYDHVVIDCGHPLSGTTQQVTQKADHLYLVCTPKLASLRSAKRLLPILQRPRADGSGELRLIIGASPNTGGLHGQALRDAVGISAFHILPEDPTLVEAAIQSAEPVCLSAPQTALGKSYRDLAARVLGREPAPNPSLFSRIFRRRPLTDES